MIDPAKIDQLIKKVTKPFDKFIYFEDPLYRAFSAIYVLLTYFYEIFDKIPYLQIYGLKGSGKSFLGSIFEGLCFKPFKTGNISTAAIYRRIGSEHNGLTLIIDEKDDLSHSRNDVLLGILRSGYAKGGSVTRCVKGTTAEFSTFCPKIIINEKGIQDSALESRTIPIHMVESDIAIERFRKLKFEEECKEIKNLIHSFVKEHRQLVLTRYHSFKSIDGIKGRDEEVWTPILVIAGILETPDAPFRENDAVNLAFIKDDMVDLAKKIIAKRKRMQLIGNMDTQILEATWSYIKAGTASGPNDSYLGEELLGYIRNCWSNPGLRLETVSRTLKRHDVITSVERRRVREKGLSTPKMCYKFDKGKLEKLVKKIL